jgi:hypothetical protein
MDCYGNEVAIDGWTKPCIVIAIAECVSVFGFAAASLAIRLKDSAGVAAHYAAHLGII